MGFVAILGVLALVGILIRNSVILIVQIEEHRRDGMGPWDAVLDATIHRTRPIMLTAAAASLALIPISREGFWAPMAFAMMGGIIVGTVLTLLFLPALYVAWFRVKPPVKAIKKATPPRAHISTLRIGQNQQENLRRVTLMRSESIDPDWCRQSACCSLPRGR